MRLSVHALGTRSNVTRATPSAIYRRAAENEVAARSQGRWKATKKASGDPNFSRRRHWPLTYLQPISRIHTYNALTSCLRLFAITFPARFKWLRFRYSYVPRHARGVYLFSIKDPDAYILRAFLRSGNVFVPV